MVSHSDWTTPSPELLNPARWHGEEPSADNEYDLLAGTAGEAEKVEKVDYRYDQFDRMIDLHRHARRRRWRSNAQSAQSYSSNSRILNAGIRDGLGVGERW